MEAEKISELLELPTVEICNFFDAIEIQAQSRQTGFVDLKI